MIRPDQLPEELDPILAVQRELNRSYRAQQRSDRDTLLILAILALFVLWVVFT